MSRAVHEDLVLPPEVQKVFDRARNLTTSIPRKHHIVPESYLRRWEENGQIRVTDVDAGRDYVTSPGRAARVTDFYKVDSEDLDPEELPPLLFELVLGHIEGWGKAAIDHLLSPSLTLDPEMAAQFVWFLAMQLNRGALFRAEMRANTNEFFKLQYAEMSDEGIRRLVQDRIGEAAEDSVALFQRFVHDLRDGSITVEPQQAALVGEIGQLAARAGEYLLSRTWVIYETGRVLITCDEPVVLIGGSGLPRSERAGVATAAVILFPLDPSHVLALFRDDVALKLGVRVPWGQLVRGQLDTIETAEVCREIAMNAHRWAFERPSKRRAVRFQIPPLPEASSTEDVGPIRDGDREGRLIRTFRPNRWRNAAINAKWPVDAWWS